jgi:hypothetical protein
MHLPADVPWMSEHDHDDDGHDEYASDDEGSKMDQAANSSSGETNPCKGLLMGMAVLCYTHPRASSPQQQQPPNTLLHAPKHKIPLQMPEPKPGPPPNVAQENNLPPRHDDQPRPRDFLIEES